MKKNLKMLLALGMAACITVGCGSKASDNAASSAKSAASSAKSTVSETKSAASATSTTSSTNSTASTATSSVSSAKTEEKQSVAGRVTNVINMTKYEKGKKVRVWLPVPHNSDYQTVENVAYDTGKAKAEMNTDSNGNQILYVEWGKDVEPADRVIKLSFDVKRDEVLRPELKEDDKEELTAEIKKYLEPSKNLPLNDQVKNKAKEVTEGKTTDLEKTRAIYDWVIANMNRNEDVKGCGEGDVCALLDTTMSGKCTDINSMFVALCRASGIPAREHFGIRINADDITKNQHCWAEFYLKGTGWVSADPADVLKAVLKNGWTKDQKETKEKQEYYWGNCDAERIILADGRDLTLTPAQDGEPLNDFGYPYAEVDGKKVDNYTPDQFIYTYSFVKKS